MVDSVNVLILAYRRFLIDDIFERLGISVGTSPEIAQDNVVFSKVGCWLLPKTMTPEHKHEKSSYPC